ncbi:MAG: right-handed parallel beta-helix repeat-containing protein [Alphaproteobacteria bacterium]|nr:right-handed parallel beta-helix repeat-containing protein [Alphaproteobacteria bacterium]
MRQHLLPLSLPLSLLPLALPLTLALGACGDKDGGDSGAGDTDTDGDTDGETDTDTDGGTDTDTDTDTDGTEETTPTSPCADGGWGALDDPTRALHVRADGDDDTATGSGAAPFGTLVAALDAWADSGKDAIFIGPGTYPTLASIAGASSGGDHDGLELYGCSSDEVTLEGVGAKEQPVLYVAGATDVLIDGLHFSGAKRALTIWQGAEATVTNITCSDSELTCLAIDGTTTTAVLSGIAVSDPVAEAASGLGLGIAVTGASLTLSDATVTGSVGVGVLVHQGSADVTGLEVKGVTSLSDGTLGRGLHVQSLATTKVRDSLFSDNEDAGIFAHQAISIDIGDTEVRGTDGAAIPDSDDESGDGIVITDDGARYEPGTFRVALTGNTVADAARGGIVVDGSSIGVSDLSGNVLSGLGYDAGGTGVVIQNGATVEAGSDGWYDADTEGISLDLNRVVLSF